MLNKEAIKTGRKSDNICYYKMGTSKVKYFQDKDEPLTEIILNYFINFSVQS